jgi:integrase
LPDSTGSFENEGIHEGRIRDFGRERDITPHTWRHSVAVQLVAADVDVTVIRNWLGHPRLDTTNHYARANLETKRKALEQVDPATKPGRPPRWKWDPELMSWLDSL